MSEFDEQWEEENYMNVSANRTEVSDFDKWVRDNFYAPYDVPTPEQAFEAGHQSQQAKIDELQGRIDEALRHVVDHGGYDDLTHVISILKGNKNEKI